MKINPTPAAYFVRMTPAAIVQSAARSASAAKVLLEQNADMLTNEDKTQLKAIAAELDTVTRRLEWLISGKY